ncbi:hypothetical protein DV735_g4792, partial [Chaetothyriales sp. CBS 134920]
MSYQYSVNDRRRRQNRGTSPSFGQVRTGSSRQHSGFGHWVPLVLTVGAAAIGIAAWIWSERREEDDDGAAGHEHYPGGAPPPGYTSMSGGLPQGPSHAPVPVGAPTAGTRPEDYPPPPGAQNFPPGPGAGSAGGYAGGPPTHGGFEAGGYSGGPPTHGGFEGGGYPGPPAQGNFRDVKEHEGEDPSFVSRVSNAFGVGRSASPAQKTLDWAGKKVSAGVAAAGAMAGAAMKSMGMSGEDDAERWSEEADNRPSDQDPKVGIQRRGTADEFYSGAVDVPRGTSLNVQKRTTVAVVVSAVEKADESADLDHHASILAHLPEHINRDTTRVVVLIYAPGLKVHPLKAAATRKASSQSIASSFSNISQHDAETPAHTPGEYAGDGILTEVPPNPIDQSSSLFKTLYNQAVAVVESDTLVLPYTTANGHKHILKSLGPEVVYIQESLCGKQGELVNDLSGWVRQIVVVIGDEGGTGGLVDTDDEESKEKLANSWWRQESRTGLGRRVTVVDGAKIGDDWDRRLNDKD